MATVIKIMELQDEDQLDTLLILIGTNDISRTLVAAETRWEPLLVWILKELKEKYKPRLVILSTAP